jgi:hypothetical protein
MSTGVEKSVFYFEKKGPHNTDKTLEIALACCNEQSINKIVVASSRGDTALKLKESADSQLDIIAVTYSAGSRYVDDVEAFNQNVDKLKQSGTGIVRGLHALSGTERAFESKYKTQYLPLNIVADTLRMFCHGVKVCVEIAIMAAEHGYVSPDEEIVAIAGSHHGADTAVVLKPAYASDMFKTKIKRLLCMPG